MLRLETLTIAYFIALACAAPFSGATWRQIATFLPLAGSICLLVVAAATAAPPETRAWLAHLYLVAGYWLPALLVRDGADRHTAFEAWLVRSDAAWRRHEISLPHWTTAMLEMAYLLCYPAVPFAFGMAWIFGTLEDADRFWMAVLASGYLSYGSLPWLVSRPPRALETGPRPHAIAGFNAAVLRRVSHQLNTFPSGHVAVSVAAALSVLPLWWPGGAVLMAVAMGVAIGAVAGRYHYLADVILGIVVGIGCALLSRLVPISF